MEIYFHLLLQGESLATPFGPLSLVEAVQGQSSSQTGKTLAQRWEGPEGTVGSIPLRLVSSLAIIPTPF